MKSEVKRRDFLKGVLSGSATAVMAGCMIEKPEKLIPYVVPPEDVIPGQSKWYSSVCRECPAGCGVKVRQREGRVIKVEGNSQNPVNEGGLCLRGQASLNGLYDPDRLKHPYARNQAGQLERVSWEEAMNIFTQKLQELQSRKKMKEAVFLSGHITGSRSRLIDIWTSSLGMKKRITYEPFSYEPLKAANEICFGKKAIPVFALNKATYLLSFGADFLETWLSPVRYAKDFSRMRKNKGYSKFIHVEPRHSLTAANADEWISVRPGTEVHMVLAICHELLNAQSIKVSDKDFYRLDKLLAYYKPEKVAESIQIPVSKIKQIAQELGGADSSLVLGPGMAGAAYHSKDTWVAVNLLNYLLGNINKTVLFSSNESIGQIDSYENIDKLIRAMRNNRIPLLITVETNPVYTLPKSVNFTEGLKQVPFVISFSTYLDETSSHADLILPLHTWLESWDDYESREGLCGLLQPTMTPVANTKNFGDILIETYQKVFNENSSHSHFVKGVRKDFQWKNYYDFLRDSWRRIYKLSKPSRSFEDFWETSLRTGGHFQSKVTEQAVLSDSIFNYKFEDSEFKYSAGQFYYYPYPSIRHYDGRNANYPWLQEIPDPITLAVWDSWIEVHPKTAERLAIKRGDLVKITSPHGFITAPVYIYEGIQPDTIAIPTGLGHKSLGRYAMNVGANAFSILPPTGTAQANMIKESKISLLQSMMVSLEKTGQKHQLVILGGHSNRSDRNIIQTTTEMELRQPAVFHDKTDFSHTKWQMYSSHEHPKYRWGMSIDLDLCTGCGACVAACYAENNIAVTGKDQCSMGREIPGFV